MKKKILSLLLIVVMCFGMITTAQAGEPTVVLTVTADNESAKVGEVVTFTVTCSSTKGLYGLEAKLDIPSEFTYVANSGALADGVVNEIGGTSDSKYLEANKQIWLENTSMPMTITGTVTLATFQCTANTNGDSTVSLKEVSGMDENGEVITYSINPANTTINAELTGEQAVTGIVAPSKGASPDTTTGTAPANTSIDKIEWFNGASALTVSDKFQGGETYTVKVTLKPDTGYAFAAGVTGKINGNVADVEKDGDNIVLSYTFGALPVKEVSSIAIITPPDKTEYVEGQSFDKTGMVVEATYDDYTKGNVTEFTYTPDGALTTTNTSITVSFGGQTANQAITVVAKEITSIDITREPTKTVYEIGDTPDWSGMEVTASYNDDSSRVLESSEYSVTGFNSAANAESQTITVTSTSGSKTDTFTVKIDKKTITAANAFDYTAPANLVYNKTDKEPTVTKKTPYDGSATVTYEKGGEAVTETNTVGTYKVFVSADETSTYKAIEKTEIGQFTVTPKELSMAASVTAKNFDGNRTATITKGSLTGVESGDAVSIAEDSITGTFNNEFAGTGKAVTTANEFTLSGADKNNYTLRQPTSLTGNINAATQTITANESKLKVVKNGSLMADTLKANISGAIGDLTFTVKSGTAGTITSNAFYAGDTTGIVTVAVKAEAKDLNVDTTNEYSESSEITFEIEVVSKYDAGVTIQQLPDEKKVTYGDTFTLKAVATNTETDGTWKWTVDTSVFEIVGADNTDTLTVKAKAADASAKDITAKYESSQYLGEKKETITVEAADITVKANNFNIYVNGTLPDLSSPVLETHYTVEGLVGGDVLSGTVVMKYYKDSTEVAASDIDVTKTGIYDIVISGATAPASGNYNAPTFVKGTLTIANKSSSGGGYLPPVQKPTITSGEGVKVTLSADGTVATIKVDAGYELVDVVLNGTSKGKVTEVKGLKAGDKLVVTAAKKAPEPAEPTAEEIIATLADHKLAARSKVVTMKNGKKAVRITWYNRDGEMMEFDGVEIFRSTKRNSGYGKKPIFTSETDKYYNTAVKAGTKYYYKLRGYVVIDGQKYYTDYSLKAIRTVN